jgi:hypothetical protein
MAASLKLLAKTIKKDLVAGGLVPDQGIYKARRVGPVFRLFRPDRPSDGVSLITLTAR